MNQYLLYPFWTPYPPPPSKKIGVKQKETAKISIIQTLKAVSKLGNQLLFKHFISSQLTRCTNSQVPSKRVYSLNYCNVELLALFKARSSTLK